MPCIEWVVKWISHLFDEWGWVNYLFVYPLSDLKNVFLIAIPGLNLAAKKRFCICNSVSKMTSKLIKKNLKLEKIG